MRGSGWLGEKVEAPAIKVLRGWFHVGARKAVQVAGPGVGPEGLALCLAGGADAVKLGTAPPGFSVYGSLRLKRGRPSGDGW